MTATQLPSRPPGTLSAAVQVEVLHLAIDDLHTTDLGPEDASLLGEVDRARTRLDALRLKLIGAAHSGGVAEREGQATTADWVAKHTRSTRHDSGRDSALASSLAGSADQPALETTGSALADGALSAAHAKVIADALHRLPQGTTPEQRTTCETRLITDAARLDPTQLRRRARRILEEIEPDPTVVDTHENDQLVDEEDAAYAKARLTLHDNDDGTTTGRFTLPRLQADILRKLIDAITAPRRSAEGRDPGARDRLDPTHARGLALAQLLEHLPTDHLHGPATTQVTVLIDIDTLHGHLKAAGLDTDHPISAGEARRLACTSALAPAIIGTTLAGTSRVLDLGRSNRLFTNAQRRAIHATHTHCATRDCTRPIAWCELHHRTPWSHGGRTDLNQAVPLCGWHHRRIHDHRYAHDWHTDGTVSMSLRT